MPLKLTFRRQLVLSECVCVPEWGRVLYYGYKSNMGNQDKINVAV